ncbi:MAG: cytochrome c oxidase subunit II [Gammaproteobacteria bacterium]
MYQTIAWLATLPLVILLLLVFVHVARRAGEQAPHDQTQRSSARIRAGVFWGLLLLFVPLIVYSLNDLPYPRASEHAQIVKVTGQQWRWELSPSEVKLGQPVEFQVTAADVNHGFALYGPNLRLVAQTQAMPGYTNRLQYTFSEPGVYRILCSNTAGFRTTV